MSVPNTKQEYSIERVSAESMPKLSEIAFSAFGVKLNQDKLKLKYDTGFAGVSHIGYLAISQNGNAAAYYGVFPMKMKINGDICTVAQSGDTMTHKEHQGNGLFVRLAKESYQLAKENEIAFVFGFPNGNSYPGFVKKLDWLHTEDLVLYSKRVFTLPLSALAYRIKFVNGIYRFIFKQSLSKREWFESSILASGQNGVFRNAAYWDYKGYGGNFTFKANGVLVWAKVDGVMQVGDVQYLESVDYNRVFKSIKRRAQRLGCHKIVFQCSKDSWLASIVRENFEVSKGLPVGFCDLSNTDAAIFPQIHFVMADFDTF